MKVASSQRMKKMVRQDVKPKRSRTGCCASAGALLNYLTGNYTLGNS